MIYLWELDDERLRNVHGVVDVIKYLGQFLLVGRENFRNRHDDVLDFILLKAKLQLEHLDQRGRHMNNIQQSVCLAICVM